jgi:protein-disulfide isomerase
MTEPSLSRPSPAWIAALLAAIALGAGGGWLAARQFADPAKALSGKDREAIETVVREYLLENPEVLPQAMENLQRKANRELLAGLRGAVEKPFPGAVLGNPAGKVTIVEFTDFACGYCRKSVADLDRLIGANPDLRVVVRDLPILSPESEAAARMALAAAEQGKYRAFHHALFALGQPGTETIAAAAQSAGLDLASAREAAASERVSLELARNGDFARQLGFGGTPSWIIGEELISGAVGYDHLARSLAAARP